MDNTKKINLDYLGLGVIVKCVQTRTPSPTIELSQNRIFHNPKSQGPFLNIKLLSNAK